MAVIYHHLFKLIPSKDYREIISSFEFIKYVHVSKSSSYYIFKEAGEIKKCVESCRDDKNKPVHLEHYNCVVIKAYPMKYRLIWDVKGIESFLKEYKAKIEEVPEYSFQNILKRNISRINSPEFATPIRNFFRKIGLLGEVRGKVKSTCKDVIKERNKEVLKIANLLAKKNPLRKNLFIKEIQRKLEDYYSNRRSPVNPDELRREEKVFSPSDATIRRIIKSKH